MARYVDVFLKVSIPKRTWDKWLEMGRIIQSSPGQNIRDIVEFKLHGLNKNITVTAEKTEER